MLDALTTGYGPLFAIPAIAGSFFFLLRLILMAVGAEIGGHLGGAGGMHDFGGGIGHDAASGGGIHDLDSAHSGGTHDGERSDSTHAFKILSVQTIAGFIMGFGWGGLGAYRGAGWDLTGSVLAAIGGGILIVYVITMLFRSLSLLQSSGNIPIDEAIGCKGSIYVGVPAKGTGRGKVRLVVEGDHARIYNAISNGEQLPRNTRVRVVTVNRDNTVTVVRDDSTN